MKIYRIAFRNPFDTAANKLAKQVQQYIIKMHKNGKLFQQDYFTTDAKFRQEGFLFPIGVKLEFDVNDMKNVSPVFINAQIETTMMGGRAYQANIAVMLSISKYFTEKDYNKLYMDLIEAIRHEFEHLKEAQEGTILSPEYNVSKLMAGDRSAEAFVQAFMERTKYISDKSEQMPFIRGMMLRAKKSGMQLKDIIRDYVHKQLFSSLPMVELQIHMAYPQSVQKETEILNNFMKKIEETFPNTETME
jgi:hypothetical protein